MPSVLVLLVQTLLSFNVVRTQLLKKDAVARLAEAAPQFNPVMAKAMSCDDNAFNVQIEFKYPFYGVIYTESSDPLCMYVEGRKQPQRFYNFTVPMSETCGTSISHTTDTMEMKNTLMVQRDPVLIERFDNSFTLLCQKNLIAGTDDGHVETMAIDRLQVLGPKVETIKKVVKTGQNNKVKFSGQILMGSGTEGPEIRNQIVQLGERLTYVFRCNVAGSRGEDCAVGECFARDETGQTTVQLADANACSLHPSFWSNFEQISDSEYERVFVTSIWAWSFPASEHVLISCRLRVCNGYCDRDQCPAAGPRSLEYFQESPLTSYAKGQNNSVGYKEPQDLFKDTQFEALTSFAIDRDFLNVGTEEKTPPRLYAADNDETYCISKTAFVTVITVLVTTVAIMTITVCLLLWRLQRFSASMSPNDYSSEPIYS